MRHVDKQKIVSSMPYRCDLAIDKNLHQMGVRHKFHSFIHRSSVPCALIFLAIFLLYIRLIRKY